MNDTLHIAELDSNVRFDATSDILATSKISLRRLSVAPMLDLTNKHYRYMARQISRHAWLYSEMIHADAIVYGDRQQLLAIDESEHPVALQLGGSDAKKLAEASRIGQSFGYDEINLNCGCPSPRVQKGAFGACLMRDVELVADCLNMMQDAVGIPVTIKHRIGLDEDTDYQVLADFVGVLSQKTSCQTFIIHARNAWLNGLSPKENRHIPPLNYPYVYRLKKEFSDLEIILNGGVTDNDSVANHLQYVDGVMVGREAYYRPMMMQEWDRRFYGDDTLPVVQYDELIPKLHHYAQQQLLRYPAITLRHIVRHYLGLVHGVNGARQWRKILSDATLLRENNPDLILEAWQSVIAAR